MADAFDMRTNIKGKPGSQGTLFQVADKSVLNPQQRWPQGYTPERLGAVRDALRTTPISAPQHLYDQPDSDAQAEHGVNVYGYRERMHREIAKTTIPPEHLQGIREIHGEPDEGSRGTYWTGGSRDKTLAVDLTQADTDKPRFPGFKRTYEDARRTLTHEIGHHVNMSLAPTPHVHDLVAQIHAHEAIKDNEWRDTPTETDVSMARSRIRPGVDEAQADDYLVQHYRTGGRKPTGTNEGAYERNFNATQRSERYPGYNDVRPPENTPSHQRSLETMQQAQFQPGLFSREAAQKLEGAGLRRKMAAQANANRQALAQHIAQVRGQQ